MTAKPKSLNITSSYSIESGDDNSRQSVVINLAEALATRRLTHEDFFECPDPLYEGPYYSGLHNPEAWIDGEFRSLFYPIFQIARGANPKMNLGNAWITAIGKRVLVRSSIPSDF